MEIKYTSAIEMKDTADMMLSEDYRERFLAEYWQTKIRHDRLHEMLIKHSADTLGFVPACPDELLVSQVTYMMQYLKCLEIRAEIEGIDLHDV